MPETPRYTLRRTWPDVTDRHDDFVIRCDSVDVGRLYYTLTPEGERWQWTIYINAQVHRVAGVPIEGLALSLDDAKTQFRTSYERMLAASG
jgi:hypothetical protein